MRSDLHMLRDLLNRGHLDAVVLRVEHLRKMNDLARTHVHGCIKTFGASPRRVAVVLQLLLNFCTT